jgi:polyphosphate kinase 2 (PPK2 family)
MGSISNHYGDVANWVENVIDSCETPQQENAARKLIRLFEKRIEVEVPELYWYYNQILNDKLDNKFYNRIKNAGII